jgi:hypothetical protein
MKLTRDKIQRMVGSKGLMPSGAAGGGSIGITEQRVNEILQDYVTDSELETTLDDYVTDSELETTLADYATKTWVNNNYISIEFFSRLFQAHGTENNQQTDIDPNDMDSTITSIEAMFGFWTEQYLSALGNSGGGSVSLTLANMGDVSLNNLADGQILVYDATEGKWVNTSASIVGNYLPLTGGTLTGDLFFAGYNNRKFGIKLTAAGTGQPTGTNIDVGWDWDDRDGAGAFFRSSEATTNAGDFGFFARNATQNCELLGKPDGTLTWGNANVLTSANVKTINGESIYGTGNIVVGGGGSAYLPLAGGTMTGNITLEQGVAISSGGYPLLVYRPSNNSTISSTQWGGGATNSQGVIRSSASDLLHWRGSVATGQTYAILDEYNATTILDNSYLPLTGGTLTGKLTINAGVLNITGETSYGQGIRIHPFNGTSSIFFGCDADSGMSAGMFGITHSTTGLRIRGQASTSSTSLVDYLTVAYGGNVGIGTTSPSYKLHVNGTIGAGDVVVENLESEGYVSALSDERKKDVVEYMDGLTIEQIASMPIIKFTWKDRPEEGLQVGSVAQEWQKILPQSVHKSKDDYLSFSYGVAALVGTISNSRELVKHDARLSRIEKMLNINID